MQLAAVDPFMDKGPTPHLKLIWVKLGQMDEYGKIGSFYPAELKINKIISTNFHKNQQERMNQSKY